MSNIHVTVRCRDRLPREVSAKSARVIDIPTGGYTPNGSVVVTSAVNEAKSFTVDGVFGGNAEQSQVFDHVVLPLVGDFLAGTSVTVFTYGQTGTGKTYTMVGDPVKNDDELPRRAGIIPRVLKYVFDHVSGDYTLKCQFVELYNEQLHDLISSGNSLRLFEQDGKVNVNGAAPCYLQSYHQGCQVLAQGLARRRTAATKLNDQSSRSHMIFTLELTRKIDADTYSKVKINLCDLAGSENVSRSGVTSIRAKEAGNINKSLLTLGRVITALAQNPTRRSSGAQQHIPYRESNLTRLLQDSLGGSTKTALVATISPVRADVDETISTLDYATKAKNIKNDPDHGPSDVILKRVLVKDLTSQIASLSSDLDATKAKTGVYMTSERHELLVEESKVSKTTIAELQSRVAHLEQQQLQADEFRILHRRQADEWAHQRNQYKDQIHQLSTDLEQARDLVTAKNDDIVSLTKQWEASQRQLGDVTAAIDSYASSAAERVEKAASTIAKYYGASVSEEFSKMKRHHQGMANQMMAITGAGADAIDAINQLAKVLSHHEASAKSMVAAVSTAFTKMTRPNPVHVRDRTNAVKEQMIKGLGQLVEQSFAPMVSKALEASVSDHGDQWNLAYTTHHDRIKQAVVVAAKHHHGELTNDRGHTKDIHTQTSRQWEAAAKCAVGAMPEIEVPSAEPVVSELLQVATTLKQQVPQSTPPVPPGTTPSRSPSRRRPSTTPTHTSSPLRPSNSPGKRKPQSKIPLLTRSLAYDDHAPKRRRTSTSG